MFKPLEKVKKEINPKEYFENEIKSNRYLRSWIAKRNVIHVGCTRITNQNDYKDIKNGFPFGIRTYDDPLFECLFQLFFICFFLFFLFDLFYAFSG